MYIVVGEELQKRFRFYKATTEGPGATEPRHLAVQERFTEFAQWLHNMLPSDRSSTMMFSRLEEASMWAHKAIGFDVPLDYEGPMV